MTPLPMVRWMLTGLWLLASCATPDAKTPVEALAAEKYGEAAEVLPNDGGTYVLVRAKTPVSAADPLSRVRFFVYDVAAATVTYEAEVAGAVDWADAYHLDVFLTPGTVRDGAPPAGYRLDVRTGARHPFGGGVEG